MNEYRVKVTVRNNLILSAIERAGYKTQAEFCRSTGIGAVQLNSLIGLRDAPINRDGEFSVTAKGLMEALGASPSELWTDRQLLMELERNSREREISELKIDYLLAGHIENMTLPDPTDAVEASQVVDVVGAEIDETLTPMEAKIVRIRFGIGCEDKTLEEIGVMLDLSRERIRQIEAKALRKLRRKAGDGVLKEVFASLGA